MAGLAETTSVLTLSSYKKGVVSLAGEAMQGMSYWLMADQKTITRGRGEMVVASAGLALGYFMNGQIDEALTSTCFKTEFDPTRSNKTRRVFYTSMKQFCEKSMHSKC